MESGKGFIRFQKKRSGNDPDIEYGTYCVPQRVNGKKINNEIWLGRVIDKEKGIFYNKKDNYFTFTISTGKSILSTDIINNFEHNRSRINTTKYIIKRSQSIQFGDIYIFNQFLSRFGLYDLIKGVITNIELFCCLILFRLLSNNTNSSIYDWWNETYMRYLYPSINLQTQSISTLIAELGTVNCHKNFFNNYKKFIKSLNPIITTLIDSTNLQNSFNIPLNILNNYNSALNNEIRLITVIDRISDFPIYYRYIPGNIVDISTLSMIINEVKKYNININNAILDAGYYSEDNINLLYKSKIPFITRMIPLKGLYESLISEYVPQIKNIENYITYGERKLFIKKISTSIFKIQSPCNCFICLDLTKYNIDSTQYFKKFDENINQIKLNSDMLNFGVFILVSTIDLDIKDILPIYYTRQSVDIFFDYIKNEIDILPLGIHSEEIFAGHILISFIATVALTAINNELKKYSLTFNKSLDSLKRFNCHIFKNKIIPDIVIKNVNDVLKALKIKIPSFIDI
jgi:hypothetical protein